MSRHAHANPFALGAATVGGLTATAKTAAVARLLRLDRLVLLVMRLPHIDAVAQDSGERARCPARSRSGLDTSLFEPLRDLSQTQPLDSDPLEDLPYDGGFALLDDNGPRLRLLRRQVPVAIRRVGPPRQRSGARPEQSPAARPFAELGPLVLGENAAHLQRHPFLVGVRHPAHDEDHLHLPALDLLQHDLLIDEAPGQPIRIVEDDAVQVSQRNRVAQRLQPRPQKRVARPAVVDVAVLRFDRGAHRGDARLNRARDRHSIRRMSSCSCRPGETRRVPTATLFMLRPP